MSFPQHKRNKPDNQQLNITTSAWGCDGFIPLQKSLCWTILCTITIITSERNMHMLQSCPGVWILFTENFYKPPWHFPFLLSALNLPPALKSPILFDIIWKSYFKNGHVANYIIKCAKHLYLLFQRISLVYLEVDLLVFDWYNRCTLYWTCTPPVSVPAPMGKCAPARCPLCAQLRQRACPLARLSASPPHTAVA